MMDGSPFGGGGGGPYYEGGDLSSLSAGEILQLVVDLDLTNRNSVGELLQTLTFDEVFTSMTNMQLLKELLRVDLVADYADIDDLVAALPAVGVDLDVLRPDGLLTALTTARGGSLLVEDATTAKADLQLVYSAVPLTFLNIFDARSLLELFDDSMTTSVGAAIDAVYAVGFNPADPSLQYILKPYVLEENIDDHGNFVDPFVSRAIERLNALPVGNRVMMSKWHGLPGFGHSEGGVEDGTIDMVDTAGNPMEFISIWSDVWEDIITARYLQWFGEYHAMGGKLDAVIIDMESKDFSWQKLRVAESHFDTPSGRTVWQTIFEDPRWPSVKAELNAYGLSDSQLANIANWNPKGLEPMLWNAVMERRRAEYLNRAIYEPIRTFFPNVRLSNYGNYYHAQTTPSGYHGRFTETWYSVGSVVGSHQAKSLYSNPAPITTPLGNFDSTPPSQSPIRSIVGVNGVVTVTTYTTFAGLQVGDTIRIYQQVDRGIDDYLGMYTVHQVLNDTTITFLKPGNYAQVNLPVANATGQVDMFNSWNALIYDLKYLESQVAASNLRLDPWVASPQWSEVLRGFVNTQWEEEMLHIFLHDVDEVVYWNTPKSGMDAEGVGNMRMNDVLAELQPLIGFAGRTSLVRTQADWSNGYALSGMEANGRRIWRFTPAPWLPLSISTGVNTTFTVNGRSVTIPNSSIYTPANPVSDKGFWVIQTAGVSELVASVDHVLSLLAEAAGGGTPGEGSVLPIRLGQWDPTQTFDDVRVGDFDGDGDHDVAGRSQATGQWWIGRMAGATMTPEHWATWSTAVTWDNVQVGDFNGDGRDDLAGRNSGAGDWWVAVSTGESFVSEYWGAWSTAVNWQNVSAEDVDGDGDDDLVGRASDTGDWWVGQSSGAGFFAQKWGNYSTSVAWTDVRVADFTGDGKADVAGRALSNGAWWVGVSNGSQFVNSAWGVWSTDVSWADVLTGDFDGDGTLDILGHVLESGQWWLARSSAGLFTNVLWGHWPVQTTFQDLRVLDLDGDGFDDVIGRAAGTGDWWKGRSQPTGMSYEFLGNRPDAVDYVHKLVMDLDGDGYTDDFVGMNGTTGDWWWDF